MELLHELSSTVVSWVESPYAVWLLFGLAFAESSFFPIPPDVLMIPLAIAQPPLALFYALISSIGSVLGGMFGYLLGLKGGRPILFRISKSDKIHLVEMLYKRFGSWAVGISAFSPIPYKVFTISAGVFALNFRQFVMASAFGRSGRFFLVGGIIMFLGPSAKVFIQKYLEIAVIGFTVLLIGGFWGTNTFLKIAHKRLHDEESDSPESSVSGFDKR